MSSDWIRGDLWYWDAVARSDKALEKRLYMETLGCPKNRVDSEIMLGTLARAGYSLVREPSEAEVIVVNTCAFIGPAKQESIDTILELAEQKKAGRCETLVVTGCLPQRYAPELAKQLPEVDHFVGTSAYAQIADLLAAETTPRQVIPDPEYIHDSATPRINSLPRFTALARSAGWTVRESWTDANTMFSVHALVAD